MGFGHIARNFYGTIATPPYIRHGSYRRSLYKASWLFILWGCLSIAWWMRICRRWRRVKSCSCECQSSLPFKTLIEDIQRSRHVGSIPTSGTTFSHPSCDFPNNFWQKSTVVTVRIPPDDSMFACVQLRKADPVIKTIFFSFSYRSWHHSRRRYRTPHCVVKIPLTRKVILYIYSRRKNNGLSI